MAIEREVAGMVVSGWLEARLTGETGVFG